MSCGTDSSQTFSQKSRKVRNPKKQRLKLKKMHKLHWNVQYYLPSFWLKILSNVTSPFFSKYLCMTLRTLCVNNMKIKNMKWKIKVCVREITCQNCKPLMLKPTHKHVFYQHSKQTLCFVAPKCNLQYS